jgi:transposase
MSLATDHFTTLIKALLPEQIFDYFEITKVDIEDKFIDVHLDELNLPPKEYSKEKLISKGFHEASVFQDFPIREKAVYLHVRRRKWQVESSGKIISKHWNLSAQGTRYTKDFATFLKELFGQLPHQ